MSNQQHERDYLRGYATALIDAIAAIEFARNDRRSLQAPANAWLEGGTEDALKVIRAMKPPSIFDDRKLPAVEREPAEPLTEVAKHIVSFLRSHEIDGGANLTTDEAAERIEFWFLRQFASRETLPPAAGELIVDVRLGPSRHTRIEGPCGVRPAGFDEVVAAAHDALKQAAGGEVGTAPAKLDLLLASIDEWLGNSEGLMIEDVIEWREMLAAALGKPPRDGNAQPLTSPVSPAGKEQS